MVLRILYLIVLFCACWISDPVFIQSVNYMVQRSSSSRRMDIRWIKVGGEKLKALDESWILDVALSRAGFSPISPDQTVEKKIADASEQGRIALRDRLTGMVGSRTEVIDSIVSAVGVRFFAPPRVFTFENPPNLALRGPNNCLNFLSKKSSDCRLAIGHLSRQVESMVSLAHGVGFEIRKPVIGSGLARHWVDSRVSVKFSRLRRPTNEFESFLFRVLKTTTGSFVSNLEVMFDDPSESHEFDVILSVDPRWAINIELMDYSRIAKEIVGQKLRSFRENWKSSILLRSMDWAARLGPEAHLVIVLRGFNPEMLRQMWEIARSRGVVLMSDFSLKGKLEILLERLAPIASRGDLSLVSPILDRYNVQMNSVDEETSRQSVN